MTNTAKHISATCSISNGSVRKNGQLLFHSDEPDLIAFLQAVYKQAEINYSRFYKMDALSKLGWLTSELLLKDTFVHENYKSEQVAMVFTNANASLDSDLKYMASVNDIPSPALFVYTLPNIMLGEISIRNNFKGETAFFILENFDAVFIEQYINNLFLTSGLKSCICGWVDVLGEQYKSVLYLIESDKGDAPFTAENMNLVFNKA